MDAITVPAVALAALLTAIAGAAPLQGTRWKAIELTGESVPKQDPQREAYLEFQADDRVSGSDGCNRIVGSFHLAGDRVTFGQMAGTRMACLHTEDIERGVRDALKNATRLTIDGDHLELFDRAGTRLAMFAPGATPSVPASSDSAQPGFAGTSWQLVKFQSSDDTTLVPDDRTKYTIEFKPGGQLAVQIDCNRGRGTWKIGGPKQMTFGPLALTRAQCPPGSLHDQIVKQWPNIRSFVLKDGHLFLALKLDSGIYEFEPAAPHARMLLPGVTWLTGESRHASSVVDHHPARRLCRRSWRSK